MFEDSLVESTGRIHTRSRRFAVVSLLLQAAVLVALILVPYFYPAALPKQALTALLVAPPPPMARAEPVSHATVTRVANTLLLSDLTAPSRISQHAAMSVADGSAPADVASGFERGNDGPGVLESLFGKSVPPAPPVVLSKPRTGPLRISAGVAEGRLLTPIRPVYPAIAKAARIQGTIVVEATISRSGTVENLKVVSGPPMLAQAAINAITQARYQPYQLNGEAVEVQTTIDVVFMLNE